MTNAVYIALDLGSDTIKIAYAYHASSDFTGKIVADPTGMTAIPAVAYYDAENSSWLFGDMVDAANGSFLTVVKVSDLLRLLRSADSAAKRRTNAEYYFVNKKFPKYYFPRIAALTNDIAYAERMDMTFEANITPAEVVEGFFGYVRSVIERRLDALFCGDKCDYTIEPCLVYPPFAEKEYLDELKRLVNHTFGKEAVCALSMAKALCAYAKFSGRLSVEGDRGIIFNIGEEQTSLVKVTLGRRGISIDGVDGHNPPIALGGADIDNAIARFIDDGISSRETMGRPSCGEEGHIAESALNVKRYLFVNGIKDAKIILGMPVYENRAFRCGVPVSTSCDLFVQRYLTRQDFSRCIGLDGAGGIADRFVEYIRQELARPLNSDVEKIFLTGGPVETYGLVDYIRQSLADLNVSVETFEKSDDEYVGMENNGYNIMSHEDALYAPAIGCATAAMYKTNIDLVLALTYGVRLFRGGVPFFKVLVDKGTRVPPDGAVFGYPDPRDETGLTTGANTDKSEPMHIMSTYFSEEDLHRGRKSNKLRYIISNNERILVLDTERKATMDLMKQEIGLRVLNDSGESGLGACVEYLHRGARVRLCSEVYLRLGVKIDGEGFATAYAVNDFARNRDVDMRRNRSLNTMVVYNDGVYENGEIAYCAGGRANVPKTEIEFAFNIEAQLT